MHVVDNPAGRLITFRIDLPIAEENSERASLDLRSAVVASPGPVIVVTDLRVARTFSPETTDRFIALMKSDNPRVAQSALLLAHDAAILHLQVARMLKEAVHPARKIFFDGGELCAWLDASLTREERAALDAFLNHSA